MGIKLQKIYVLHITIYEYCKIYGNVLSNLANNLCDGIHRIKCK